MRVAVTAESTIDLTKEQLAEYDIKVVPFEVILGDEVYNDGEISSAQIFDYVNKHNTLPKTTALNQFAYQEFFENVLSQGYDAIIHVALSSGITSSCNNAINASKNVKNCYIVDSLSLTTGIGLLAIYARQLADKGLSPEDIYEKVCERRKNLQVSFVIERLDYLSKGGRCSSLQLLGANLLKIRPRIILKDGKMVMDKKYRGAMPLVIEKYATDLLTDFPDPDLEIASIVYSSASFEMIENAKKVLLSAGFKTILESNAGATVTSHCGENTLGICFFYGENVDK